MLHLPKHFSNHTNREESWPASSADCVRFLYLVTVQPPTLKPQALHTYTCTRWGLHPLACASVLHSTSVPHLHHYYQPGKFKLGPKGVALPPATATSPGASQVVPSGQRQGKHRGAGTGVLGCWQNDHECNGSACRRRPRNGEQSSQNQEPNAKGKNAKKWSKAEVECKPKKSKGLHVPYYRMHTA